MEEDEILLESWLILKEYIKDKQQAADHWMGVMIDNGIDEDLLITFAAGDRYLKTAIEYNGGLEEDPYLDEDEYEYE
tara:strand:+ start:226 stop:456 length:231 start_codon:yes stop_codon:yes gene_type:complete